MRGPVLFLLLFGLTCGAACTETPTNGDGRRDAAPLNDDADTPALDAVGDQPRAEDSQAADTSSHPCGTPPFGYIEWNGTTVDYRGTVTAHIPGCTQNADGVYWDLSSCQSTCDRLGPGGVNCDGMCGNINVETTTDEAALCTQAATIAEPQQDNVELGRMERSADCTGIAAVGTVTSNLQGCRQNDTGVYWDYDACLADCLRLAAGGLNCRSACNLINTDANRDDVTYCTY